MKKIIVILFLFAAVNVSAQDIPDDDTTSKPAITEIGKPDGKKAEMQIGKDGGIFISADGKVKLIVPEGAVSKKTTFSIQPVTNLMPNGNGKAYRLEPSGIQFQKPVELVFHYDPEESEDSAQLLMGIAMQDDKGQWYGLNEFTLDTAAKTISGNINHFSVWATFDHLKLVAYGKRSNRVKVRDVLYVVIEGVSNTVAQNEESYPTDPLSQLSKWKPPQKGRWSVNGIIKGNDIYGTLKWGTADESMPFNFYTAPPNVPDWNPVTISVELVGASFKIGGRTVKNPKRSLNILIYDNAYEVTMTSYLKDETVGKGYITYDDFGSFVVELSGKKTKIIEKLNKNTVGEFIYEGGACTMKQLEPGNGWLHMMGLPDIVVTPATSTQPARVKIQFKPTPVKLPLLEFDCPTRPRPKRTIWDNGGGNVLLAKLMSAFPHCIEFTAKEVEHEWLIYEKEFNLTEGEYAPTDKALVFYIIRKLKDDEQ